MAHLLRNAEGLAAALQGVVAGEQVPMYPSQERRDGDIDELAAAVDRAELRDRLLSSTTELADALAAVPADAWGTSIERVAGGRTFPATAVPGMRLREVEIHHADLGAGYTPADWPDGVAVRVVDAMRRPRARRSAVPGARRATVAGAPGPSATAGPRCPAPRPTSPGG